MNASAKLSAKSSTIAARFNARVAIYDREATLQRRVADHFAGWCRQGDGAISAHLGLEIGCGTGFLTRHLIECWPSTQWLISDLAPAMVAQCQHALGGERSDRLQFAVADGATAASSTGPFDLIVSNLVFQWFDSIPSTALDWFDRLRPGGWLMFSVLGAGSFRTAKDLLPGAFNALPSKDELRETFMRQSAVDQIRFDVNEFTQPHHDLQELLRHLRRIGADCRLDGERLAPSALHRAMRDSRAWDGAFPAEYEVVYVGLRKKA